MRGIVTCRGTMVEHMHHEEWQHNDDVHVCYFSPHLPVTPAQLMRAGID